MLRNCLKLSKDIWLLMGCEVMCYINWTRRSKYFHGKNREHNFDRRFKRTRCCPKGLSTVFVMSAYFYFSKEPTTTKKKKKEEINNNFCLNNYMYCQHKNISHILYLLYTFWTLIDRFHNGVHEIPKLSSYNSNILVTT